MKIIEISRTISGRDYDNISVKATVDEGDDVTKIGIALDEKLRKILFEIDQQCLHASAVKESDKNELPF